MRRVNARAEYNEAGDKAAAKGLKDAAELFYDMAVHSSEGSDSQDAGDQAAAKPAKTIPARRWWK